MIDIKFAEKEIQTDTLLNKNREGGSLYRHTPPI